MAATTVSEHHKTRGQSPDSLGKSWSARTFAAAVVLADLACLALGLSLGRLGGHGLATIVGWTALVAVAGFLPIPAGEGLFLGAELPLLLAAAVIFGPIPSGLIAIVGTTDLREVRRRITLPRALFSRCQASLSVMAAAWVFQVVGGRLDSWPLTAAAGLAALAADSLVNYSIIAVFFSLVTGERFPDAIRRLRIGTLPVFLATYVAFGFLGLLIAETERLLGFVVVVGFLAPVFVARQMFLYRHGLISVGETLSARTKALKRAETRLAEERGHERARIAEALHDEVLQSLYGVTLRAQVIREDLRSGRLLDLDNDLPDLINTCETAVEELRAVIRDLRRSTLGARLIETLALLGKTLKAEWGIRFSTSLDPACRADADVELATYHIAREAMINAVKHSKARLVQVTLEPFDSSYIRLVVEDDGVGFDPAASRPGTHFGLELMKERALSLGGAVEVRSSLGGGTTVTARLPRQSAG